MTGEKEATKAALRHVVVMMWAVGAVLLMVLPIPPWVLDILLTASISLGLLLLLVAMEVPGPLAFTSFPTVLLMVTLFRLSLNVASTRLILLTAQPGAVITSFGRFVVGGEVVVGLAVFVVITVVQFLVVAKGAERISEVAARFSLDAMPGKQLAIDADLRNGHLSPEEAARRRRRLDEESSFYGAMDGAMKFVKGDAIAGLVISGVNLVAGLVMGVVVMGMDVGEAVETYSILTVGDGLVSQIPSVLSAVGAGILVTRVSSPSSDRLGATIVAEMASSPLPFVLGAVLLAAAAAVPGMPAVPFVVGAVAMGSGAYFLSRRRPSVAGSQPSDGEVPYSPIVIRVGPRLGSWVGSRNSFLLERYIPESLGRASRMLGIALPGPVLVQDTGLGPWEYALVFNGVEVGRGEASPAIRLKGPVPTPVEDALPFSRVGWWWSTGGDGLPAEALVAVHMEAMLLEHGSMVLDMDTVRTLLEEQSARTPQLVAELHRKHSLPSITSVLRRLVEEGISLAPLQHVIEALVEVPEGDAYSVTEAVRARIPWVIHHSLGAPSTIRAYGLGQAIEDEIALAIDSGPEGPVLRLDPSVMSEIISAVGRRLLHEPGAVLLVSREIRRFVWRLLSHELRGIVVLCADEILPDVTIEFAGEISLSA